jgi:hypothetical protein
VLDQFVTSCVSEACRDLFFSISIGGFVREGTRQFELARGRQDHRIAAGGSETVMHAAPGITMSGAGLRPALEFCPEIKGIAFTSFPVPSD